MSAPLQKSEEFWKVIPLMPFDFECEDEKCWWVSCKKMTILVVSKDGIITGGAPIINKFIGQPLRNLKKWLEPMGDLKIEKVE